MLTEFLALKIHINLGKERGQHVACCVACCVVLVRTLAEPKLTIFGQPEEE
jgi:hypothetical protein